MQYKTELQTTKKVARSIGNINFDESKSLNMEKITEIIEITQKVDPKSHKVIANFSKKVIDRKVENLCFNMVEVTADMVSNYRKKGIPSIVVKIDGILYYSAIPNNISFLSSNFLGAHLCASQKNGCHRLSSASDENGGCEKVRKKSTYIERYPWIVTGYETFNTKLNSFVVIKCSHYKPIK